MDNNGMKRAYIYVLLNAAIIGFSFLFAKQALQYAHPLDTLAFRFAVSFAAISIPAAFGRIKLRYRGKPVGKALLLAALYPLAFFTLQAFGLQHATSAEGGILYAFTPVVTIVLASIFLKETTTVLQKLSIAVSVFGVVFIFIMKGSSIDWSNLTGLSLLFLTCVVFAGYSVLARSLSKHFSPAEITYLMMGVGCAAFLIVSLTEHTVSGTLGSFLSPLGSGAFIVSILFLGIISSLVTALTANYVLSKMEASKMSVFTNLSTITSIAAGAIFLNEEITIYHVLGSILIIAGVLGTNWFGRKAGRAAGSGRAVKQLSGP